VFVADGNAGLQILDVSIPSNPRLLNVYPSTNRGNVGISRVAVSGNLVYVVDFDSGLQILDASDLKNLTFLGNFPTIDHILMMLQYQIILYLCLFYLT
jgi:hypothetical protein